METILSIVRSYQQLIVGLIGFTGVIVTLLVNAKLARLQVDRTNAHNARALRVALKAELEIIKSAFEDRISKLRQDNNKGGLIPAKQITRVYNTSIEKIGLLEKSEVEKIMHVYLLVDDLANRLVLLTEGFTLDEVTSENIYRAGG